MPFCSKCGHQVEATQSFCQRCGSDLRRQTVATTAAPTATSPLLGMLEPGEQVVFQCTYPELWAKESYVSIPNRQMASSAESGKASMQYNMGVGNMSPSDYSRSQSEAQRRYAAPNLERYNADDLLVTDRRLVLVNYQGQQIVHEISLDPERIRKEMAELRAMNHGIFEKMEQLKKGGFMKQFSKEATDPLIHGAVFTYPIITEANVRYARTGGQELEVKITILNPSAKDKILPFGYGRIYGGEKHSNRRPWGLKFREENNAPAMAQFLDSKAALVKLVLEEYD